MKRSFVLVAVLAMLACGSAFAAEKIVLAGSTTNQLGYVNDSIASFQAAHSGYELAVSGGGTGAGMKGAIAGKLDIGMASRHLKKEELDAGLVPTVIGWDAIAVIVNKKNPVNDLTMQQLKDINTGKITNWKEVGGVDKAIIVVTSHKGSATRKVFQKIVMNGEEYDPKAIKVKTTRAETDRVAKFIIGIGAVSTIYVDDRVKVVTVDGISPTKEAVLSNEYKISRPLALVTKGEPSNKAKVYIDYMLSPEGQKIVTRKFIGASEK